MLIGGLIIGEEIIKDLGLIGISSSIASSVTAAGAIGTGAVIAE